MKKIFFPIFFMMLFLLEVGYAFGAELELSLKHAVELGILKNREVIIEKYLQRMALEKILEAKGIFDPVLSSNVEGAKGEVPDAEIFYPTGFYKEEAVRGGLGAKGKAFTGADYGLDFFLERYTTTSQVVTLSPRYSTRLELSIVQPFLKDFGPSITKTKIRLAETGAKASTLDVKDRVVKTVNSVEEAYWNLVYSWKNLDLQKESLNLARRLFAETEVKVNAGELAPLNLLEAKSGVAKEEENVISAENELKKAEYDLKLILGIPDEQDTIVPVERPKETEVIPDLAQALDLAQKNRPDLQASKFRADQKKIEEKYTKNQLLPRLDLIGKYGRRGLSGSPSTVIGSNGLPIGTLIAGSPFEGKTSIWDSFEDLVPGYGFMYWSVGLKLEFPLGNRAAEGRYRQTVLERKKMETETQALDEKISNEVKKGILDVRTTIKMREASKVTIEFTEENLKAEGKRLNAGESTTYDVLRIQRELTDARTRHLKALIENNKAWSKVRAAEGVSLEEYEIEFNEKML